MTQRRDAVFSNRFENEPIAGLDVDDMRRRAALEQMQNERTNRIAAIIAKLIDHATGQDTQGEGF